MAETPGYLALARSRVSVGARKGPAEMNVGFVGLGRMGAVMAANLVAAGWRVVAYLRRPERSAELAALGIDSMTTMDNVVD